MSLLLRRRAMTFRPAVAPETWDYSWQYKDGAPDTSLWEYPVGDGTAAFDADNGLHLMSGGTQYAGLRYVDMASYLSQQGVLEVNINVARASANGIRIILASGSHGASDNKGLQVTINGNFLNVLRTDAEITSMTNTAPFTYNAWHTVRLEIDIPADANKVYLDGRLVDTVANADLSTQYASSAWCLAQIGECYIRAFRYKGDGRTWLYRSGNDGYACESVTGGWKVVQSAGISKTEIGLYHSASAEINTVNAIPSGTLYLDVMGDDAGNAAYAFKIKVGDSQILSKAITDGVRRTWSVWVPTAGVLKLSSYFGTYHIYNVWMEDVT